MKWNIIADSSCDLLDLDIQNDQINYSSIPFVISIGDRDFVDNADLDVSEMITSMEQCSEASRTSCPSPYAWLEQFEKPGNTVAVTISSQLSGSYNSACVARDMILENDPERKIVVIDSRSAGPEIILIVKKLCQLIALETDFDSVVEKLQQYRQHTHIIFALSSFKNLVKNGRMSKFSGFVAGKLGFWGIGIGSEQGTIEIKQRTRGCKKALAAILNDMKERGIGLETVVISHCQNAEFAEKLKKAIQNIWHRVDVKIVPTRGLCSYYAEKGGLIVGF